MKQGTSTSMTRNLNARQHYLYYFKYILRLCLNKENDLVVLVSVGKLLHSILPLNLIALFSISDCT